MEKIASPCRIHRWAGRRRRPGSNLRSNAIATNLEDAFKVGVSEPAVNDQSGDRPGSTRVGAIITGEIFASALLDRFRCTRVVIDTAHVRFAPTLEPRQKFGKVGWVE